jgi:low affinity Fe/Cu permease
VVVWAPSFFVFGNIDTWQLVINTTTTIITFLLVALFQNTQERFERRMREDQKVERLALAILLEEVSGRTSDRTQEISDLIAELEGAK